MVSEPSTGYICGFEVYTGDASSQSQGNAHKLQDASKISCIVLGLLDSAQLLDMGHHVHFDNYYNSPDLIDLWYKRKTHTCGTVRKNKKSLPSAVTQTKLKKGETVFHHKNNLLALMWMDKREVYTLGGLHKVTNVISKKLLTKGKRLLNLNQSSCTIGTCQVLIWQINFYSITVFCVKVTSGQRNSLCIAWTWSYSMHTFSTRNIQTAKNALAVQDTTSKAHVE